MADEYTEQIIGSAIEVHRILGPGLLEAIYEEALCHEFALRNVPFKRQVAVDIQYKGKVIRGQRIDLIAYDEVVLELKATKDFPETATAQVLSYLKALGLKRALLINFGAYRLADGIKRISL
jgi:GxxExxY protein